MAAQPETWKAIAEGSTIFGNKAYITDGGVAYARPFISFTQFVLIEKNGMKINGAASFKWNEVEAFYIAAPYIVFRMKWVRSGGRRAPPIPWPIPDNEPIGLSRATSGYRIESGIESVRDEMAKILPEIVLDPVPSGHFFKLDPSMVREIKK